jgi:hypothetical protein
MKSHIFQAILIAGTVIVLAAIFQNMMRTPQHKLQRSTVSRPTAENKDIKELCADIWSGKRAPYLSFELWCADIKPLEHETPQR